MEDKRLTNKNLDEYNPEIDFCSDCKYYGEPNGCNRPSGTCDNYDRFLEIYNRLVEFEDKIENRTLIDLPCKVGDTVYEVFKNHIPPFLKETKIEKIVITAKGLRLRLARNSFYETAVSSIGKTIFFTKEQAEEKLKELKSKE